ncbi:MAG: molybdopterin-dependent oxidoreductase [Armatimonas sp.]
MLFGKPDPKLQGDTPPGPEDAPEGAVISPDTRRENRIPSNQSRTKKWPVLDAGVQPEPDFVANWTLSLTGLVDEEVHLTWEEFQGLPRTKVFADMHCVTRWSRLGNVWEGVSTRTVFDLANVDPTAKFVHIWAWDEPRTFYGGSAPWSTNLPLEWFLDEDCLFADTHDGAPLTLEHGAPLRLIIPKLYAWKSAKWVKGIEFRADDAPGFWERGGYHMLGDPWKEQRFR